VSQARGSLHSSLSPVIRPRSSPYGEFDATVNIGTLEIIEGELPHRALNLVQEWAMIHREELLEDWRFCREKTAPPKIEPLA
jgi:hypothetical protein